MQSRSFPGRRPYSRFQGAEGAARSGPLRATTSTRRRKPVRFSICTVNPATMRSATSAPCPAASSSSAVSMPSSSRSRRTRRSASSRSVTSAPACRSRSKTSGTAGFLEAALRASHRVALGFPAVATFAAIMALATVLHLDRFNYAHPAFWGWAVLYVTTPILVLVAWLRNRRTDPETAVGDVTLPASFCVAMATAGVINIAAAVVLMAAPTLMIGVWPWQLTPLTARVMGGWFALPGVVALAVALDRRWSSARIVLQSQIVGILLILMSVVRAWGEFNQSALSTWLFVGGVTGLLILVTGTYAAMELQRGPIETAPPTRAQPTSARGV